MKILRKTIVKTIVVSLLGAALLAGPIGCTTNPASGGQDFTPFMMPDQERKIGAEQHPKIVAQFGGVYQDPKLQNYLNRIGNDLVRVSEMAGQKFTFTLLDSPVVNAFALPGGYVYVTRGLLTLANSEAELAGVIGHEIGHVTGRHSAQRQNTAIGVGLLATILGIATRSRAAADIGNLIGQGYVAYYTRDQEFEADRLGIRYLGRGGYYPFAQADFLAALERESKLARELAGISGSADPSGGFFATHPNTADRVSRARGLARQTELKLRQAGRPAKTKAREQYLSVVNGMVWGNSAAHGFVRGRRFSHPALRFTFQVPAGYQIYNHPSVILVKGPNRAEMKFSAPGRPKQLDPVQHIRTEWAPRLNFSKLGRTRINGFDAAVGLARVNTNQGSAQLRLVALRYDQSRLYRFLFVDPVGNQGRFMTETVNSFRRLSSAQAARLKPRRLRIVQVGRGASSERFARMMKVDKKPLELFRVLNNLSPGQQPKPGSLVKVVTD